MNKSATYPQITGPEGYLSTLTPFRGNSLSARIVDHGHGAIYEVKSYATVIAWSDLDGSCATVTDERFSVTTSRAQNACRAWLGAAARRSHRDLSWLEDGRLQRDSDGAPVVIVAQCGECGFAWNDALITSRTPAPSGRCPVEASH